LRTKFEQDLQHDYSFVTPFKRAFLLNGKVNAFSPSIHIITTLLWQTHAKINKMAGSIRLADMLLPVL
jgi:hypothetical protein